MERQASLAGIITCQTPSVSEASRIVWLLESCSQFVLARRFEIKPCASPRVLEEQVLSVAQLSWRRHPAATSYADVTLALS